MVRTAAPVSAGIAASVTTCPSNEPSRCTCRGQAADSEDEPVPLPSRVAYPRWRGHVLAMQGGAFVVPWPRFAWQCHPTTCRPPPSSSRPEGRRPGVEGPVQTALPQGTRRYAAASSSIRVNVGLQPLNAMTQLHQRCRFATLKNGFLDPRCFALLRTASLGMTTMRSPLRGIGWHAHAGVGMS